MKVCIIIAIGLLVGCGGSKTKPDVPKVLSCVEKVLQIMAETPTCQNRARKIKELLNAQSECFEALTGENAPNWMCAVDAGVE